MRFEIIKVTDNVRGQVSDKTIKLSRYYLEVVVAKIVWKPEYLLILLERLAHNYINKPPYLRKWRDKQPQETISFLLCIKLKSFEVNEML